MAPRGARVARGVKRPTVAPGTLQPTVALGSMRPTVAGGRVPPKVKRATKEGEEAPFAQLSFLDVVSRRAARLKESIPEF